MVAAIGRHLRQPIDAVEDWDVEKFYRYYEAMSELLEAETPSR